MAVTRPSSRIAAAVARVAGPSCGDRSMSLFRLGLVVGKFWPPTAGHLSLIAALKACGTTNCGSFTVDPTHIEYLGISLGGIIGSPVKQAGTTRMYLSGEKAAEIAQLFSASMLDARSIGARREKSGR